MSKEPTLKYPPLAGAGGGLERLFIWISQLCIRLKIQLLGIIIFAKNSSSLKDRNKSILFFILGAITALFVVESRKEKPFEGLKNWARKLLNNLKIN